MLLAIDTSAGTDLAIVTPTGDVLAQFRLADSRRHAEAIGPAFERVFADAALAPSQIERVIVGMGPGPFTGLRVGVAAGRMFAAARGIPVAAMPSHDAIAREWRAEHGAAPLLVTTDARRRELAATRYAAGATASDGRFELIAPAEADALAAAESRQRVDAATVSAAQLALAWLDREARGIAPLADEILYLRAPDAKPGALPKRVTA